jgi:pyrroline-5-carboxylate reductase
MLKDTTIAFIGGGTMGTAMIKGILAQGLTEPSQIRVSDPWPPRLEFLRETYGVHATSDNLEAIQDANIIVLSVKPQVLTKVGQQLHGNIRPSTLILSILAGSPISVLRRAMGHDRIVRAMPNTPGQLGKGITVWTSTPAVTDKQKAYAEVILGALGEQLFMEEEGYLDMATALSGSGPGFIFLFIEALIDAGVHMGFSRRDAGKLVIQTLEGSVALFKATAEHPAELKNQVTSPGGTTAAGLYELEKGGLRTVLSRAIFAAYRRSQELGALSEKNGS